MVLKLLLEDLEQGKPQLSNVLFKYLRMQESQFLERIWEKYKEENTYSEGIAFADTLDIVSWIGRELEKY